jgi:hypothetical protein
MDAFINQELASDGLAKNKQLSPDEALCKYGQPSPQTGEACARAGLSTTARKGVDAYGQSYRGDFERCKFTYELVNGKYEKVKVCQQGKSK